VVNKNECTHDHYSYIVSSICDAIGDSMPFYTLCVKCLECGASQQVSHHVMDEDEGLMSFLGRYQITNEFYGEYVS